MKIQASFSTKVNVFNIITKVKGLDRFVVVDAKFNWDPPWANKFVTPNCFYRLNTLSEVLLIES